MNKFNWILNAFNLIGGILIGAGVWYEFGPGWAMISCGAYLAYNVITTAKVINVRNTD